MRKIFCLPLLIILLSLLPSCRKNSGHDVLERVNKQISHQNSENLLVTLDSIDISTLSDDDRAWHAIIKARARQAAYIPQSTDTVLFQSLMYYASKGRRDTTVADGYLLYGKGLINDSTFIEGLSAVHHAYDMAMEVGDTITAANSAFVLAVEYSNKSFVDEALNWVRECRELFTAVNKFRYLGYLDYIEANLLYTKTQFEDVLKFYDEHYNAPYPRNNECTSSLRVAKANALSYLGRNAEALALMDSIMAENDPEDAYFYFMRAKVLMKLGNYDSAAKDVKLGYERSSHIMDSMHYHKIIADYKAGTGDLNSAYLHLDTTLYYSEKISLEDANRHPGGYLAKYYSEQERIARRDAAQARTIAILEACVALLLDVILVLGTSWVIRWHRKSKAEQQALLDKVAQLQKQAEESTDNKNTDSGDFQMGLTYLVTLCSTLRNAKENVAGSNTEFEHDIDGIIDYYRSGKFFATLEEDINRYYNNWAVRFSGDTTNIPPEYYKLALVLFLRLPTDAMSFLLNKSKSAISTQKTRLKEMLVQNGANGIKYFEALNISRNNL